MTYASFESINATLDYDFGLEKSFDYAGLSVSDSIAYRLEKSWQNPLRTRKPDDTKDKKELSEAYELGKSIQ